MSSLRVLLAVIKSVRIKYNLHIIVLDQSIVLKTWEMFLLQLLIQPALKIPSVWLHMSNHHQALLEARENAVEKTWSPLRRGDRKQLRLRWWRWNRIDCCSARAMHSKYCRVAAVFALLLFACSLPTCASSCNITTFLWQWDLRLSISSRSHLALLLCSIACRPLSRVIGVS